VDSPAVVVAAQPPLSVGVFKGVVRVLEGLIPEEAGFPPMQAGLVLEAPVVLSVGSVALCKEPGEGEGERKHFSEGASEREGIQKPLKTCW